MRKQFNKEVQRGLQRTAAFNNDVLGEEDIRHLPLPVQKYLKYAGAAGKEKISNMYVAMHGRMRGGPNEPWMRIHAEQYSFFDEPTRLFYIKARKAGLPVRGIHLYKNEEAMMLIKLLGLFTVVDEKGPVMDKSETVTMFNDMCMMAPATLIDKRIEWEEIDAHHVKAVYTNGKNCISAKLAFNDQGQIVDFISNDRSELRGKDFVQIPWSTPVEDYREQHGVNLPCHASALYHRLEGAYDYANFEILEVKYNIDYMQ